MVKLCITTVIIVIQTSGHALLDRISLRMFAHWRKRVDCMQRIQDLEQRRGIEFVYRFRQVYALLNGLFVLTEQVEGEIHKDGDIVQVEEIEHVKEFVVGEVLPVESTDLFGAGERAQGEARVGLV